MSEFRPDRVRPDYKPYVDAIRDRHGDEVIVDWIERYYASPDVNRDDVMEALDIDYVGTFYELVKAYDVKRPELDPAEEERQIEVMRLLLDGQKVPQELLQPRWWKPTFH